MEYIVVKGNIAGTSILDKMLSVRSSFILRTMEFVMSHHKFTSFLISLCLTINSEVKA
jgi:hypothetical protein